MVPSTLEDAIAQAKEAVQTALDCGCGRIIVDLAIPEIALQAQAIALEFTTIFADYGEGLKVMFPDSGAAALAKRDWGEKEFQTTDLGSRFTPIDRKISPDDRLFLLVCPSAVEIEYVEKLCNLAGDRPVIMLIPQLESVATIGIGYAARQLRERFLSTLETAYFLKPFEGGAIYRIYPSLWQVWVEGTAGLQLIAEEPQKPAGDRLENILMGKTDSQSDATSSTKPKKAGFLGNLQKMLKALNQ
ncbi:DUF1995 family protein [Spirulina sp. 06S082]|uniref:DUF1995 family protein n=1 Tax=Spirulina sp. 06S082 TaxID=3110248 RepID=UPI002B2023C2|nr:DUF1995 family protein [Spirulina sp. 06S082]MEA5467975.1 DUF1995 family protein [Spirulina sp. 06S082]